MSAPPPAVCRLVPGSYGVAIQFLLASAALASLLVKKRLEDRTAVNNRSWTEFLLDSSKQIIGGLWVHVLNIYLAVQLHKRETMGDSCDWYFANIVVDCTIGTAIEFIVYIIIMRGLIPLVLTSEGAKDFHSGEYGGTSFRDMSWPSYLKQLGVWILVCTIMKLAVYHLLRTHADWFLWSADLLLSPRETDPARKLWIVMIFTPLVMNTVQLWIIDNFLKRNIKKLPIVEGVNKETLLGQVS